MQASIDAGLSTIAVKYGIDVSERNEGSSCSAKQQQSSLFDRLLRVGLVLL